MFLSTNHCSLEIVSALELQWEHRNDKSDYRPFHAISYRIEGDSNFLTENDSIHLASREIAFVPANHYYTLQAAKEHLLVVHFSSDDALPNTIKKFIPHNPYYFEQKFLDLFNAWSKKQVGYEYECKSILYKILFHIERETALKKYASTEDTLKDAIEYIHDNFTNKELTVDYLAGKCGMSDTYFRKLFVKNFAVTPLAYINKLKLTYAIELLQSNYYTITEIAEKCGFNNINYFCMFIKKETGFTPSDIRSGIMRRSSPCPSVSEF